MDMDDIASPTVVYSNNHTCWNWSKTETTKGLKHLNLWEKYVHKYQQEDFTFQIKHISGKINCADVFTKEFRDSAHFRTLRNSFMSCQESFLLRQTTFSQRILIHPAANLTILSRLPTSPPKQSVQQTFSSPSLPLPHYLTQILSTLGFILDILVPVQEDLVRGLGSRLESIFLGLNLVP